ncbi:Aspercryptin biosynthesis cluster-specific transcription regulator atnN [Paramyrothecium foliicola]|nr:Aspercryptin biosynthesis cluster-specific transcription regulator atnN [Paramyrothecium foliicola]
MSPTSSGAVIRSPVKIDSKDSSTPWKTLYEPAGLGEIEGRLLTFYESRTALELDGDFQDDFWRRLVLQQPASPTNQLVDTSSFERHATYYYSKAVQLLNEHISSNQWASLEETLLCCVLCIRFEWIAGNRAAALVHLRSSLQILRQWQTASSSGSPTLSSSSPTSFWSPGGYLIRTTISPIYMRLALEASMLADKAGSVPMPPPPFEPVASECFVTLKDARDSLYEILGDEHLYRRSKAEQAGELTHTVRNFTTMERFNQWSISLTTLLAEVGGENSDPNPAILALRIWQKIVRIMLENKGKDDECVFDSYSQDFSDAVDLATTMYSMKNTTFSPDTSVVAVLFYIAIKCRHPTTRRRAIALLIGSSQQEGIWNSALAVRLASYTVEREEMAAGCAVRTESDVPQAARVNAKVYTWEEQREEGIVC